MGPQKCSNCSGPHAASSKDCHAWQMEEEIQRIRVEKRISFPEARLLVEAKAPAICSPTLTLYSSIVSKKKKCVKSVDCQSDLSWASSDTPACISGGPGSASVNNQASEKTESAGADAQVLRKSARQVDKSGSSGAGPIAPTETHPSSQGTGLKTSPKSQARTVSARSGSTTRRSVRPSEKLLVEGVWVDVGEHSKFRSPPCQIHNSFSFQDESGRQAWKGP